MYGGFRHVLSLPAASGTSGCQPNAIYHAATQTHNRKAEMLNNIPAGKSNVCSVINTKQSILGLHLYEPGGSGEYFCQEVVKMVKGISRQVIVVHAPDPKLFEQAIFILKDGQEGITDEVLLKEANKLIRNPANGKKKKLSLYGPVWAVGGAVLTGILWAVTALL